MLTNVSLSSIDRRRNSDDLYKSLFEMSIDAIKITNKEGFIVEVNNSFASLFGYNRDEIINANSEMFWVDKDERKKWLEVLNDNGLVKNYEAKLVKKDGEQLICFISSIVWRDNNNEIFAYQSIIKDITESKKREKSLKMKTEFIESILKAIPDDIIVVNKDKIVVWSNMEDDIPLGSLMCNSMHGHNISKPANCIKENGDPDCPIDEVFENGNTISFESNVNGRMWWHVVTPCNYNGHVSTVMELRRDITEEKMKAERVDIEELKHIAKEVASGYKEMYNTFAELVQNNNIHRG